MKKIEIKIDITQNIKHYNSRFFVQVAFYSVLNLESLSIYQNKTNQKIFLLANK